MEMILLKWYTSIQFLPAVLARHVWIVLAIVVLVALFGRRVYCRFICPLGLAQSLVRGFMGKRRICSRLDGVLVRGWRLKVGQWIRFLVLAVFVALGVAGLGWQWLDPYALASRAVCYFTSSEFDLAVALFALVPAAIVLVLAVLAGGRVWCNWVCPVGTFLSLVGIRPWKGDTVKKCAGCEKCRRCFK